jgi:hypothetical protein
MFVVMTVVAVFAAIVQGWGAAFATIVGVELGLLTITVMLIRCSVRLEARGCKYISAAVAIVGMAPVVLAMLLFVAVIALSPLRSGY